MANNKGPIILPCPKSIYSHMPLPPLTEVIANEQKRKILPTPFVNHNQNDDENDGWEQKDPWEVLREYRLANLNKLKTEEEIESENQNISSDDIGEDIIVMKNAAITEKKKHAYNVIISAFKKSGISHCKAFPLLT